MSLSQRLTDLRRENGVSQMELAEEMDISFQAVSRWETGESKPSTKNLMYLSKRYGVTVDYLLHGGELPPKQPEPAPAEVPPQPVSDRRWKIIAGVCMGMIVVLLAVLISMGQKGNNGAPHVPIENMQEDEVSPVPDDGFDFE